MYIQGQKVQEISKQRVIFCVFHFWYLIAFIGACGFAGSFVIYKASHPVTYVSTGAMIMKNNPSNSLQTAVDLVSSNNVITKAVSGAKEKKMCHFDGAPITWADFSEGLTASFKSSDSLIITVTFSNSDNSICVSALNLVLDLSVEEGNSNYPIIGGNLSIYAYSQESSKKTDSLVFVVFISTLVSITAGAFLSFFIDYKKDIIFSVSDLPDGIPLYEIHAKA